MCAYPSSLRFDKQAVCSLEITSVLVVMFVNQFYSHRIYSDQQHGKTARIQEKLFNSVQTSAAQCMFVVKIKLDRYVLSDVLVDALKARKLLLYLSI